MEDVRVDEGLHITRLHGFCPVQAEGTVDGKPLYFRARGMRWNLTIGDRGEWEYGEAFGTQQFEAGWMEEDTALDFVRKAVGLYRAGHPAVKRGPVTARNENAPEVAEDTTCSMDADVPSKDLTA